jgi:ABC-2 type transport system ATP-binding protein
MLKAKKSNGNVLRVVNVSKSFHVPHTKKHTLKSFFLSIFTRRKKSAPQARLRSALDGINFSVQSGEFFGIVGRNGSGKSTMLKMLAGIYQPTKGVVHVEGKLVPFIELGVGFNPELSGRENVYLNGAILGFSKKEIDERYEKIVAFAELENFMEEKLKNYSSGMQVRLAFSCTTMAQADILLVDEVLAVGDADFQRKCFSYFKQLKREKTTVVFVSHDMNAIREYCDRAILIEDGNIVAEGDPEDIATKYSRLFLESEEEEQHISTNRWGDQAIVTKKLELAKSTLLANDPITLKHTIFANKDVEDSIAGFRIKSASGQLLLGTNTRIKKKDLPKLKKGESIVIEWSLENVLSDGDYYIDPALVYGGSGSKIADWWEEAVKFKVKKTELVPYPFNPDISIKHKKAKS